MADTETPTFDPRSFADKTFPLLLNSSELAALGKKRIGEFIRVQTEILDELHEANRHWLDRFESEANLASEFASRLSSARTMPDAMAVSRDWATQYLAMLTEDSRHLADDTRKLIETGTRLFSGGLTVQQPPAAE
jgi:hypothetical protein